MHWWTFLRQHGQRPARWWQVATPTYWRQVNRERHAIPRQQRQAIPCGHCVVTKFVDTTGVTVRQDIQIQVGREALTR